MVEETGKDRRRNRGGRCGRLKRCFEEVNELLRIEGTEVEISREDLSRYRRDLRMVLQELYLSIFFTLLGSLLPPPRMAIQRARIFLSICSFEEEDGLHKILVKPFSPSNTQSLSLCAW